MGVLHFFGHDDRAWIGQVHTIELERNSGCDVFHTGDCRTEHLSQGDIAVGSVSQCDLCKSVIQIRVFLGGIA